jgi:hypothetical protein
MMAQQRRLDPLEYYTPQYLAQYTAVGGLLNIIPVGSAVRV